jgi:hypothetical protein
MTKGENNAVPLLISFYSHPARGRVGGYSCRYHPECHEGQQEGNSRRNPCAHHQPGLRLSEPANRRHQRIFHSLSKPHRPEKQIRRAGAGGDPAVKGKAGLARGKRKKRTGDSKAVTASAARAEPGFAGTQALNFPNKNTPRNLGSPCSRNT